MKNTMGEEREETENSDYISMLSFVATSADKDGSLDDEVAEYEEFTQEVAFESEESNQ